MSELERISMTIDRTLLRRVDKVCEARGETRSAYVSRALRLTIGDEEKFLADMESPVWRTIYGMLANSPRMLSTLATVVSEELTEEQLQEIQVVMAEQTRRGKERSKSKRAAPAPPESPESPGTSGSREISGTPDLPGSSALPALA